MSDVLTENITRLVDLGVREKLAARSNEEVAALQHENERLTRTLTNACEAVGKILAMLREARDTSTTTTDNINRRRSRGTTTNGAGRPRRKLDMRCHFLGCQNQSRGPRYGFMCETHQKLTKAEQRAAREKYNQQHQH